VSKRGRRGSTRGVVVTPLWSCMTNQGSKKCAIMPAREGMNNTVGRVLGLLGELRALAEKVADGVSAEEFPVEQAECDRLTAELRAVPPPAQGELSEWDEAELFCALSATSLIVECYRNSVR